jgi:hypothetical protein
MGIKAVYGTSTLIQNQPASMKDIKSDLLGYENEKGS